MANNLFEVLNSIANAMGKFVRVDIAQDLTDYQKTTARENIGASAEMDSISVEEVAAMLDGFGFDDSEDSLTPEKLLRMLSELEERIPELDDSLSEEGKAADAKAVGDALDSIETTGAEALTNNEIKNILGW